MRTFNEILKEADTAETIESLAVCYAEVFDNPKGFTLSQLCLAEDHFDNLIKKMAEREAEEIKEILTDNGLGFLFS